MKITIVAVGKTEKGFIGDGVQEYLGRLKHYINTEIVIVPDIKGSKGLSTKQLMEKECQAIMQRIEGQPEVIILDDKGKEFTSTQLASWFNQKNINGTREVIFVIGGAYGVSDEIKYKAQQMLSLSKLTFSHQMVRLILVEQLYRAMTIIKGEPYHHE